MNNPFTPASETGKRAKILIYGPPGSGKTTLGLSLGQVFDGRIAALDLEGGMDFYGEHFNFDVLRTKTLRQVKEALQFIQQGQHDYAAVMIDPVTVIWQVLQEAASQGDKAISFREWGIIKRQMGTLYNQLVNLPLHVVVVARQKDEYDGDGQNLKKIGQMPDAEKSLPFLFDVILRTGINPKTEERAAIVEKDRSGTLPRVIDNPGPVDFVELLGVTGSGAEYHQESEHEAALEAAELFEEEVMQRSTGMLK